MKTATIIASAAILLAAATLSVMVSASPKPNAQAPNLANKAPLAERQAIISSEILTALQLIEQSAVSYSATTCFITTPYSDTAIYTCAITSGEKRNYIATIELINAGGILIALPAELQEKAL